MPYSLSWQSTGLQNRLSQVRVLHTVPSRRAARTLPGIHAEGEPCYKTERIHLPILTGKEHSTLKREDVSKIIPGITPEQLDSIMNLHGADITAKANEITTLKAEKSTLTEQLNTANGKLEGYDPEWKAKAEQAKADAASQVAALEKGYALERKASGLTQLELAEKLGVITGTIGYYERGAGQPKTDNLFALCDILHIRPADLLRADP